MRLAVSLDAFGCYGATKCELSKAKQLRQGGYYAGSRSARFGRAGAGQLPPDPSLPSPTRQCNRHFFAVLGARVETSKAHVGILDAHCLCLKSCGEKPGPISTPLAAEDLCFSGQRDLLYHPNAGEPISAEQETVIFLNFIMMTRQLEEFVLGCK
jgi:hypothetical protein